MLHFFAHQNQSFEKLFQRLSLILLPVVQYDSTDILLKILYVEGSIDFLEALDLFSILVFFNIVRWGSLLK